MLALAMVSVVVAAFVLGHLVSARQAAVEGRRAGNRIRVCAGHSGRDGPDQAYDVVKGWPKT